MIPPMEIGIHAFGESVDDRARSMSVAERKPRHV
jgi:hypothetical protein